MKVITRLLARVPFRSRRRPEPRDELDSLEEIYELLAQTGEVPVS